MVGMRSGVVAAAVPRAEEVHLEGWTETKGVQAGEAEEREATEVKEEMVTEATEAEGPEELELRPASPHTQRSG
jgi:hypothetical protein